MAKLTTRPVSKSAEKAGIRVYADLHSTGRDANQRRLTSKDVSTKLVEITGASAQLLEANGFEWKKFKTAETVRKAGEALRQVSQHPLVTEYNLPVKWLVDSSGLPLGYNGCDSIKQALELASEFKVDMTKMTEQHTAADVIGIALPKLIKLKSLTKDSKKRGREGRRARAELREMLGKDEPKVKTEAKTETTPKDVKVETKREVETTKDGRVLYSCIGQNCKAKGEASVMTVGSWYAMKSRQDGREVVEDDLVNHCFCPKCAAKVFRHSSSQRLDNVLGACRKTVKRKVDNEAYEARKAEVVKQAKDLEARKAEAQPKVRANNGKDHILCVGRGCEARHTVEEMTVGSWGYMKHNLRDADGEPIEPRDIREPDLVKFAFCPKCATKVFKLNTNEPKQHMNMADAIDMCRNKLYGSKGGRGKQKPQQVVEEATDLVHAAHIAGVSLNQEPEWGGGISLFADLLKFKVA